LNRHPQLPAGSLVPRLAVEADALGGRLVIVGGWVRDQLRGVESKDLDAEIFGLEAEDVARMLDRFGSIGRVGQHFPVWRLRHQNLDIAYPRAAALEYSSSDPSSLDRALRAAARHRDLTLNAIAWDPLDERCIDPWGGIADLHARRLRAVDHSTFAEDPIRGLRVARLRATLEGTIDSATLALCQSLDLAGVAIERQTSEWRRFLTEPRRPSLALESLDETGLIDAFAPVAALRGVAQDPRWHPEGDVFVHTKLVVDAARTIGADLSREDREILQWGALTHDFGKATTTRREGDRIRALGHESAGAKIAKEWFVSLRVPGRIASAAEALVAHHLAPAQFITQGAGAKAYRRLARKLEGAGVTMIELERVARADHLGRTTADARAGRFEAGDLFLERARIEGLLEGVREDVVNAKRLMREGFVPGPTLGRALERARQIQDEQGLRQPEPIIDALRREFPVDSDPESGS
jgi:tRNA nucleotidyltransferase (CCA-adding enzyme)